jgi:hypothetical protein
MGTAGMILMKAYYLMAAVMVLIGSSYGKDYGRHDPSSMPVSVVQLVVSPEAYAEKVVRVVGVYHWEHDGSWLFMTRDHYESWDTASAVPLAVLKEWLPEGADVEALQGELVMVQGTVRVDDSNGCARASIVPITRIMIRSWKGERDGLSGER